AGAEPGCRCASKWTADTTSNVRPGGHMNACVWHIPAFAAVAMIAEVAAIELRRIVDVLQVEHASLFLHDPDHPRGTASVAAVGLPVDEALVEYCGVVARVMHTGRIHEVRSDSVPGGRSAMAAPLLEHRRAAGVLLVVTVRPSRRLGTFDAQVIVR